MEQVTKTANRTLRFEHVVGQVSFLTNLSMQTRKTIAALACFMVFFLQFPVNAMEEIALSDQELLNLSELASDKYSSGAVVLKRRNLVEIDESGFEKYKFYIAIKLLDEEAERDYGKLISRHNAFYYEKQMDFARIRTADGETKAVQKDAMQVVKEGANSSSFDNMQTLKLALPNVRKGSIIELQFSGRQIRPLVDGHWFDFRQIHYLQWVEERNWVRVDPVMSADIRLSIPSDKKLYWKTQNSNTQPTISRQDKQQFYTWQFENIDGVTVENGIRDLISLLPAIKLTTINDWQVIDNWASSFLIEKTTAVGEVKNLAVKLGQNAHTPIQKVQAVFEYMQDNVRYIGAHVDRGGYIPHAPEDVLQQAYGDCKDQTALIVALLSEMGVKAYPALVNLGRSSPVTPDIPMLTFNHMITYVPELDIWLDTSGETGKFPGVSGFLENQTAFVLDTNGGELKDIPAQDPEQNFAKVKVVYDFDKPNLGLNINFSFGGHMDTQLRNLFKTAPDKAALMRQLLAAFSIQKSYESYSVSNVENWQEPFSIDVQYGTLSSMEEDLSFFRYADSLMTLVNMFTQFSYLPKPEEKSHDYYFQFPFELILERHYPNFLEGTVLALTQTSTEFDTEYLGVEHTGENTDKVVQMATKLTFKQNVINPEQYKGFYEQFAQLREEALNVFLFSEDLTNDITKKSIPESYDARIIHAKQLLDRGEFESALAVTEEMTQEFTNQGEAFYLYAVALGFANQFEKSDEMFQKAEELGYE